VTLFISFGSANDLLGHAKGHADSPVSVANLKAANYFLLLVFSFVAAFWVF
jgi:hypothetical protein